MTNTTVKNLLPDTKYFFKLSASNDLGTGLLSPAFTIETSEKLYSDDGKVFNIQNFQCVAQNSKVEVSWKLSKELLDAVHVKIVILSLK